MSPFVLATRNTIWLKLQPTQLTTNLKIYFFTSWKSGAKNIRDEQLGISRVQQHGPYNRKRDVNNGIVVNSLSSSEWITGFKMLEVAVRKGIGATRGGPPNMGPDIRERTQGSTCKQKNLSWSSTLFLLSSCFLLLSTGLSLILNLCFIVCPSWNYCGKI